MKLLYWSPLRVSKTRLSVVAAVAILGLGTVEMFAGQPDEGQLQRMLQASRQAKQAMKVVHDERLERGIPIDPATDPTRSGLIGDAMTMVTSNSGSLPAKQTTVNPNFAAVVLRMFDKAGLKRGDVVAAGFSGSFPALNIAVFSAAQALGLKLIVISSASASQWGANHPEYLWIDMEHVLYRRGIFPYRSAAVSLGGTEDRALGMSKRGRSRLRKAITDSGLPFLEVDDYADSVVQRMRVYERHSAGKPIAAYVNIGGATASVGTSRSKYKFRPGVNWDAPPGATKIDSVMARFIDRGVPVIHLVNIVDIAHAFGLTVQPKDLPRIGASAVYSRGQDEPWLVGGVLAGIVASCTLLLRSPWGLLRTWSGAWRRRRLKRRATTGSTPAAPGAGSSRGEPATQVSNPRSS
jgi:poly-gamma-glutamate system protein